MLTFDQVGDNVAVRNRITAIRVTACTPWHKTVLEVIQTLTTSHQTKLAVALYSESLS